MRRTLALILLTAAFSMVALADNWTGKLLDAACHDRQQQQKDQKSAQSCMATSQTTAFALEVSGKVYKFDATGNSQAMTTLKNRADRTAPGKEPSNEVIAKVEGTESGGTIKVDKIELQ